MGKRTVERKKVVTETEEIDICDKCGLAADEMVSLYTDIERDIHINRSDRPVEYTPKHLLCRDTRNAVLMYRLDPETAVAIESTPDPKVEICSACFTEMFGWSQ